MIMQEWKCVLIYAIIVAFSSLTALSFSTDLMKPCCWYAESLSVLGNSFFYSKPFRPLFYLSTIVSGFIDHLVFIFFGFISLSIDHEILWSPFPASCAFIPKSSITETVSHICGLYYLPVTFRSAYEIILNLVHQILVSYDIYQNSVFICVICTVLCHVQILGQSVIWYVSFI